MKLFWKIFFTTMFVSVTSLVLGGYILVNANLNALLDNEAQAAYNYADIAYYSLANELKTNQPFPLAKDGEAAAGAVREAAQAININSMNQEVVFGVMDSDGEVVYTSLEEKLDKTLLSSLREDQKGWTLKETAHGSYIQAVRPVLFYEKLFFIETIREVTYIFDGQKLQYETLLKMMFGMLFAAGIVTLAVSRLLIRRVTALTKVTRDISVGNLGQRADERGSDEIAVLSQNFNRMADDLEEKIGKLQEEANKQELFVGAFSHELKTPLTSIIGYSDMLRRKKLSREQIHVCAEYIFSEGKRLETLSMKLMDLIVLRNQNVEFVPVRMDYFLDEIRTALFVQLEKEGIVLCCEAQPAVVRMEPDLMKTVFINLIDNGRKAIEGGGSITVKAFWQRKVYCVSVSDTGSGIKQQELSRIREAFYMVDKSRSRRQGGAGLGLAICDEILKLHGFDICFESAEGAGTTVTLTMKGEQADADEKTGSLGAHSIFPSVCSGGAAGCDVSLQRESSERDCACDRSGDKACTGISDAPKL